LPFTDVGSSIFFFAASLDTVLLRTTETLTRLLDACDEQLRDPDDPDAYTLATRADSIKVTYSEKDVVTGKPLLIAHKVDSIQ
jgi:hypothetical protein